MLGSLANSRVWTLGLLFLLYTDPASARVVLGNCNGCASPASYEAKARSLATQTGKAGEFMVVLFNGQDSSYTEVQVEREYDFELRRWFTWSLAPSPLAPSYKNALDSVRTSVAGFSDALATFAGPDTPELARIGNLCPACTLDTGDEIAEFHINDLQDGLLTHPQLEEFYAPFQNGLQATGVQAHENDSTSSSSNSTLSGGIDFSVPRVNPLIKARISASRNNSETTGNATSLGVHFKVNSQLQVKVKLLDNSILTMGYRPSNRTWRLDGAVDENNNPLPFDEDGKFILEEVPRTLRITYLPVRRLWINLLTRYGVHNVLEALSRLCPLGGLSINCIVTLPSPE